MNVGGFSEHQSKTIDTDKDKGYFFTDRVSQVIVNTMKRVFEQWSELQIVHLLSKQNNIKSVELRIKSKAMQQRRLRVANEIILNQVRVYHERVYVDKVVCKFWFVRSFSSQHYSKFITSITSESVSQICT